MTRAHALMRSILTGVLAAGLSLGVAACGEDEPAAPAPKKPAAKRGGAAAKGRGGKSVKLDLYSQIEGDFRRKFRESDFRADPTGDENRDPFRSYVVRQGTAGQGSSTGLAIQPTDVCTAKNSRAPNYSLRDLRVIGIVLRGTLSYAQFRDPRGFGWIVKRGDCLGKEKAIVQAIGVGSVTLEVVPESPPNTEPPPPERRDIPLYPAELAPEDAEASADVTE
jgi:hypothetical protein